MRIFIAIPIPSEIKREIEKWSQSYKRVASSLKWLSPNLWHITLVFLGEINQVQLNQSSEIISSIAKNISPFYLTTENLIVFPNFNCPSTVTLKIRHSCPLEKIVFDLRTRFDQEKIGSPDERQFKPHITLARNKEKVGNISFLKKEKINCKFKVNKVNIMKSIPGLNGSRYINIRSIGLKK